VIHQSLAVKLAARVTRGGPDECWEFDPASRDRDGYGRLRVGTKIVRAHHVAYALAYGPVPPGTKIRHSCDNPPCCNPRHLLLGTHQNNMDDMVARGRSLTGARNPSARLSQVQVDQIRRLRAFNMAPKVIAARMGVAQRTVYLILKGDTWKS